MRLAACSAVPSVSRTSSPVQSGCTTSSPPGPCPFRPPSVPQIMPERIWTVLLRACQCGREESQDVPIDKALDDVLPLRTRERDLLLAQLERVSDLGEAGEERQVANGVPLGRGGRDEVVVVARRQGEHVEPGLEHSSVGLEEGRELTGRCPTKS